MARPARARGGTEGTQHDTASNDIHDTAAAAAGDGVLAKTRFMNAIFHGGKN